MIQCRVQEYDGRFTIQYKLFGHKWENTNHSFKTRHEADSYINPLIREVTKTLGGI